MVAANRGRSVTGSGDMAAHAFLQTVREFLSMPRVTLAMSGNSECEQLYRHCVRRHNRLPIIRNKQLGVALLDIPSCLDEFLKGTTRKVIRTGRNRSRARGYAFRIVAPANFLDEVMAVNSSTLVRQNRAMDSAYLDRETVKADLSAFTEMPAVFDSAGRLVAYALIPICGEVANISRILGHSSHLESGVMYLLLSEIIGHLILRRNQTGNPRVLMYDTYFGGGDGLRGFKKRFGFRPHRVDLTWNV